MSHKFTTSLYIWVIVLTLFANARAGEESNYLSQEQLVDESKLVERYQKASKEDRQRAREMLEIAEQYSSAGKWGVASKAYGESAMVHPSVKALTGLSIAVANIPRKRSNCKDIVTAKMKDLSAAFNYMKAAEALADKANGKNADRKEIWRLQQNLPAVYNEMVKKYLSCDEF